MHKSTTQNTAPRDNRFHPPKTNRARNSQFLITTTTTTAEHFTAMSNTVQHRERKRRVSRITYTVRDRSHRALDADGDSICIRRNSCSRSPTLLSREAASHPTVQLDHLPQSNTQYPSPSLIHWEGAQRQHRNRASPESTEITPTTRRRLQSHNDSSKARFSLSSCFPSSQHINATKAETSGGESTPMVMARQSLSTRHRWRELISLAAHQPPSFPLPPLHKL